MREILVPELLSSLFTLVFLIRPLFKGLWPLDGIAWFPVLALGIALTIFPAYGFRPECVPLLFNHLMIALMNLRPLLTGVRRNAGFHERGALFIVPALGFLVLTSAAALWFAPVPQVPVSSRDVTLRGPERAGSPVYTLHVFDGRDSGEPSGADRCGPGSLWGFSPNNKENAQFCAFSTLQTPKEARESEIFAVNDRKNPQAPQTPRPLIFLVPPDFGGFSAVDGICAALEERGFTVISYSRGDSGWPGRLLRLWRAFRDGTRLKKANDAGRALEAEKMAELEFLLPYTTENLNSLAPASAGAPLFLAGWGTGASALAYLVSPSGAGGSGRGAAGLVRGPDPPVPYGARGLVVVEGRFWSSRAPAVPPPGNGAAPAGVFGAVLARLRTWFGRLRPERVGEPEAVPRPPIPTLYLVSGRGPDAEDGAYAAVFKALRNSDTPAALASLEGAGPLGYSDLPREYPLYNALLSGRPGGCAEDGAALIARFCELAAAGPLTGGTASSFTGRLHLSDGLYLETRYWNFGDLRLH